MNQGLAQTSATLITDRGFLQQVKGSILGGLYTASCLSSQLSAHAVTNTSLMQLSAQAPSERRRRRSRAPSPSPKRS